MLARWFDRSGIGQTLAPDPDAQPVSEYDESRSEIWQILAPDGKFAPPKAPPNGAFPPDSTKDGKVQCVHCHRWTPSGGLAPAMIETIVPVSPAPAAAAAPSSGQRNFGLATPRTPSTPAKAVGDGENDLNARVLSACRDTSMFMKSPKLERQNNDKFLRLCSSTQPLLPKLLKRMRSMVESSSYRDAYLMRVRATKMGVSAPDGYTSLQCAAYANNVPAAELLLDLAEGYASSTGDRETYADLHLDRELSGMTALHIAGERGNVEMIQLLMPLYNFTEPSLSSTSASSLPAGGGAAGAAGPCMSGLVDLGGQTAFGRAMTSPLPKAKKNQRTLEKRLFSRNDLSIFGEAKSNEERMGRIDGLGLHYGTADMPGLRGYMEDAMSVNTWQQQLQQQQQQQQQQDTTGLSSSSSRQQMALFAVCDGHGDNKRVSEYIASSVSGVLRECIATHECRTIVPSAEYWNDVWKGVCLQLDRNLKDAFLTEGGSTGVFALVTEREIVVANVGDSRCVLARKESGAAAKTDNPGDKSSSSSSNDQGEPAIAPAATRTESAPAAGEESSDPPALIEDEDDAKEDKTTLLSTPGDEYTVALALSEDHKPNLPVEADRIQKAGFKVQSIAITEDDGTETLVHKLLKNDKDQLAVSRAFGDFDYKANENLGETEQAVVPVADVRVHTRNPDTDLFLVLACDGIWDVMENQDVVDFVQAQLKNKSEHTSADSLLPDVADVLLHECLGRESRDNLSAILVSLQQQQQPGGGASTPAPMPPKALDFGSPK